MNSTTGWGPLRGVGVESTVLSPQSMAAGGHWAEAKVGPEQNRNTGLENPVDPQAGKPALPSPGPTFFSPKGDATGTKLVSILRIS